MRDPTRLYEGTVSSGTERFARFLSLVLQPPFIGVFAFLLLSTLAGDALDIAVCAIVSVLFSVVLPMGIIVFYARKFGNKDLDVVKREERSAPLIIGTVMYAIGTLALYLIDAPKVAWVLMLCYSVCTFAIFLISIKWKISVHATGCIGPTMGLAYAFGWAGLLLLVSYPLVIWSRYVLRKHTPAQLIAGGLLGFVITGAIFLLLL